MTVSLRDIELRHLRYFIAVAEEQHFGRAASRLFISQPSLSYAIAQLEDRIGHELVDRSDRKNIVLTDVGEALLAHAREIDRQMTSALTSVQSLARGTQVQLRVGYVDGEPLAQRPTMLGAGMSAAHVVSFRRLAWGTESALLRDGVVDALFARLPIDEDLSREVVYSEPRVLCVGAKHRLASKKSIHARDLAKLPMVKPMGGSPAWQAYWQGVPGGVDGPEVTSSEDGLALIAAGKATGLIPASLIVEGSLRYVEVRGLAPSELAVVWCGEATPAIRELVASVRMFATRLHQR